MSRSQAARSLQTLVIDACLELFAAYDVELTQAAEADVERELVLGGIIGFSGDQMHGTLVLCVNQTLLDAMDGHSTGSQDWVGELANQALGRIKNKLLSYGVTLYLSTPVVIRGQQLRADSADVDAAPIHLRSESAEAVVWFDFEQLATIDLTVPNGAEPATQQEGEMLLF